MEKAFISYETLKDSSMVKEVILYDTTQHTVCIHSFSGVKYFEN